MEKVYFTAKDLITSYKLEFCCWLIPVKIGLMLVGFINIIIDSVCIFGIASNDFSPTIMKVQQFLIKDNVIKPIPVLAYAIELGFNVVLLCAVFRNDIILLRVFLYHTVMALITSIMTYFIVIAAVPFYIQLAIIISIIFQMYCILLIRSVLVEMRMQKKGEATPIRSPPKVPKEKEVELIVIYQNGKIKDAKVLKSIINRKIKRVSKVILDPDIKKSVELKEAERTNGIVGK